VGVVLWGELQHFVKHVQESYKHVGEDRMRFVLMEGGGKILPELEEDLGAYAAKVLKKRGVEILTGMRSERMEEGKVILPSGEEIKAGTIVVATGVLPNPLLEKLDVMKDKKGRIEVEGTMRSKHRKEVWGIGDCANIPGPDGKPYPALAQHALREARLLAKNIAAVRRGEEPKAFMYRSLGTLAALGGYSGVGKVWKFKVKGLLAWWVWRTYYLMQMPRWERRVRLVVDWTIALFFKYDVVKLDLGEMREGIYHGDHGGHREKSE
jgi:NADH dehydrogenase